MSGAGEDDGRLMSLLGRGGVVSGAAALRRSHAGCGHSADRPRALLQAD